jgi:hypothetical protein
MRRTRLALAGLAAALDACAPLPPPEEGAPLDPAAGEPERPELSERYLEIRELVGRLTPPPRPDR